MPDSGWHTSEGRHGLASLQADEARLRIDEDESGSRLDRALLRRLGSGSRPLIMRLIRRGNVRVNGKRVRPDQRLKDGDSIYLPASLRGNTVPPEYDPESVHFPEIPILFEDEHLLVVNKPAGLAVHGGSGHHTGMIEYLKQQMSLPELRLAHRLDRDTSGCLLLAKRLPVLRRLAEAFRERQAHKTYLAWVKAHPYPYAGRMQGHLAKGILRGGERMVENREGGKPAITDYQVILQTRREDWPFSLLALMPESGRTHQLRVQLQLEGHAILGDNKYSNREDRRHFRKLGGKGLALHAWRLRFTHPVTHGMLELRASWPAWWSQCFAGPE